MNAETVMKIMKLFRMNLDKDFSILEISKKLHIGYRPAYNHIQELKQQKLINLKKVGSSSQCALNLKNELCRNFLEVIDITRKEALFEKNNKLKNVIEILTSKLTDDIIGKIHSIVLFGSYAKNTAGKTSDVDILVIVADIKDTNSREVIERECASFQISHNTHIGPLITDVKEFKKMLLSKELNVGKEVKEYGIALYGSELFWRVMA